MVKAQAGILESDSAEVTVAIGPRLRLAVDRIRDDQVAVRPAVAAADAAAQLVELRETELTRAVDDDRVHVRDVEAGLDDRRADEHIVLGVGELDHDPLEPALVHLTVRDDEARVRHERQQVQRRMSGRGNARIRGGRIAGVDRQVVAQPVADEERLLVARQLIEIDGADDLRSRDLCDVGLAELRASGLLESRPSPEGEGRLERDVILMELSATSPLWFVPLQKLQGKHRNNLSGLGGSWEPVTFSRLGPFIRLCRTCL